MKAIIPAAGFGTRFLPIAKAVPKEMLPLGNKPVIHHVVQEAAEAGFDEILLVISRGKESIVRYFERSPELEFRLENAGRTAELEELRRVSSMANIHWVYQEEMRGLGDAVRHGRDFASDSEIFAVLLGDTVMQGGSPLPGMTAAWQSHRLPSVCLEPCAAERVSRYGVAGGEEISAGVHRLDALVEKPEAAAAPRLRDRDGRLLEHHAFAARYLFTPEIFSHLEATQTGFGGEIQLTDAMESLRRTRGLLGVTWSGRRLDIGRPEGLYEAARALGLDGRS
ncbi:MAG: sugar phosphate nucleotidyltransferase [Terrimicrobiaceae bacterium]|nr:sugar phosphate nucleotidyltransferase [Terrimicrobiaceae bacterium]